MNKLTKIVLGVLIPLGTLFVLVATFTARGSETVLVELALSSLLKYFAILTIVTSALLIVAKAVKTGSIAETLPLTIPAVISLLILSPHWSLGIYLSALAIGHFTHASIISRSANTPPAAPTEP
ncbi:MAG: hypothetical protein P8J87_10325 [Verrucomicrobiales bacterium]|nr:hypothetical protein [Verrucomicrobiales bacterium]